jgi:hypothetical protein
MASADRMQTFLVDYQLFRGMLQSVVKGELSEAGEIALFDSFMRGERTDQINGARAESPAKASVAPVAAPVAAPAASVPAPAAVAAPVCPVHGCSMVWREGTSKKSGKAYAFWSCKQKNADGSWCDEISAALGPK